MGCSIEEIEGSQQRWSLVLFFLYWFDQHRGFKNLLIYMMVFITDPRRTKWQLA